MIVEQTDSGLSVAHWGAVRSIPQPAPKHPLDHLESTDASVDESPYRTFYCVEELYTGDWIGLEEPGGQLWLVSRDRCLHSMAGHEAHPISDGLAAALVAELG